VAESSIICPHDPCKKGMWCFDTTGSFSFFTWRQAVQRDPAVSEVNLKLNPLRLAYVSFLFSSQEYKGMKSAETPDFRNSCVSLRSNPVSSSLSEITRTMFSSFTAERRFSSCMATMMRSRPNDRPAAGRSSPPRFLTR